MDGERCFLLSLEGILDLTPTSSYLDNATNREEVQDENYVDEPTKFNVDEPYRWCWVRGAAFSTRDGRTSGEKVYYKASSID